MLGGLATVGLINLLLTLDDGAGNQVVGGLCQDFVDRMTATGGAVHPPPSVWDDEDPGQVDRWRRYGLIWGAPESVRYSVAFDPEAFVDVAIERLRAFGVRIRLLTLCTAVEVVDDGIRTVVVESKSGRQALQPGAFIDASGDADVLARAGARMENTPIPPHSWFRAGGVDTAKRGGLWFETTAPGRVLVPFGPLPNRVDATNAASLSDAILHARSGAKDLFDTMRRTDPAFAASWLDDHARMLGITESRRLVGDYVLAKEDDGTTFDDGIAVTGHWTKRGARFDIPLRCLTTASLTNAMAAGRCISTTRYVHQATKEIPAAMATGEAAGTAAAAAVAAGVPIAEVDVHSVRAALRENGAILQTPDSDPDPPQ